MEKIKFLIVLVFAFLMSCQQKDNSVIVPVNMSDTIVTRHDEVKNSKAQINDTLYVNFIDEKGLFTVEGAIDSIHPRIYVKFENDELGKLNAKIKATTGEGNIRFNQIVFPDHTSDGPFGKELEIELLQTGKHVLVVGHSLMADNPFWGKFKVELQLNGN